MKTTQWNQSLWYLISQFWVLSVLIRFLCYLLYFCTQQNSLVRYTTYFTEKRSTKLIFTAGLSQGDSRLASSQWETCLHSKAVSHWLGANLELACYPFRSMIRLCYYQCRVLNCTIILSIKCLQISIVQQILIFRIWTNKFSCFNLIANFPNQKCSWETYLSCAARTNWIILYINLLKPVPFCLSKMLTPSINYCYND